MLTLSSIQEQFAALFPGLMGVELLETAPDRVVASMKVRPDLCTIGGVLHGGALMAFADTLGAVLADQGHQLRLMLPPAIVLFRELMKVGICLNALCLKLLTRLIEG